MKKKNGNVRGSGESDSTGVRWVRVGGVGRGEERKKLRHEKAVVNWKH